MGTGVEVIGRGSGKKVAMSSDDDCVFSDSLDRAVDERENIHHSSTANKRGKHHKTLQCKQK